MHAEEDVLGLEEDILGFTETDFPPGSLSSECAGSTLPSVQDTTAIHDHTWPPYADAPQPQSPTAQSSILHIVDQPRVCGIFGDNTRIYTVSHADAQPRHGLCDSGANLCMTNDPDLLLNVRPCKPFTISLATSDGEPTHTNICRSRGLLPLPLVDGTTYYQACFVNAYASETFISPQAIIDCSDGAFDK